MDQFLSGRAPEAIRFTAGASLCAIVVPVSVLLDNPKSSVRWKEIKAVPVRNLQGLILFVPDGATESDIGELLALIAKQSPDLTPRDWIAIPVSRETSQNALVREIQAMESAGAVVIRDEQGHTVSFNLYPLEPARYLVSGLEPVKTRIPEPTGNLGARGEWFRRRSGGG